MRKWITAAFLVPVAVGIYLLAGSNIVPAARHHDFLNLYSAATFANEGRLDDLYDPEALRQFQQTIAPENPSVIPFARPHFYAVALIPLSWLPYDTAFWSWLALQTVILLACWAWIAKRFGADGLVIAAFFFPAATGIPHGQDAAMLLALTIASFAAHERKADRLSGLLSGCLLFKFHLVLLLPVAMLAQRRWKMLTGFLATTAALAAVELAIAGPTGIAAYLHFLTRRDIERLNIGEMNMVNLNSLLLNLGANSDMLRGILSLLAAAMVIQICRSTDEWWKALAAASLGASFLMPHTYQYDLTWCLLAMLGLVFWQTNPVPKIFAGLLLTPVPYLLTLAGAPWAGAAALCVGGLIASLAIHSLAQTRTRHVQPSLSSIA
jgi:hypothetical protein